MEKHTHTSSWRWWDEVKLARFSMYDQTHTAMPFWQRLQSTLLVWLSQYFCEKCYILIVYNLTFFYYYDSSVVAVVVVFCFAGSRNGTTTMLLCVYRTRFRNRIIALNRHWFGTREWCFSEATHTRSLPHDGRKCQNKFKLTMRTQNEDGSDEEKIPPNSQHER